MYDDTEHQLTHPGARPRGADHTGEAKSPRRAWRAGLALSASAVVSLGAVGAAAAAQNVSHRAERAERALSAARWHRDPVVAGKVTAVDGSTATGTCGSSGATGTFTLTDLEGTTVTVDVTSSTAFFDRADSAPSFVDVCVGTRSAVLAMRPISAGTLTAGTLTAGKVFVMVPGHHDAQETTETQTSDPTEHATGSRSSGAPWTDGTSGLGTALDDVGSAARTVDGRVTSTGASSITLGRDGDPITVAVTPSTTFTGRTGPSTLTAINVGDVVHVTGTESGGTFTASAVTIVVPAGATTAPWGNAGQTDGGHGSSGAGWMPTGSGQTTTSDPGPSSGSSGSSPAPAAGIGGPRGQGDTGGGNRGAGYGSSGGSGASAGDH